MQASPNQYTQPMRPNKCEQIVGMIDSCLGEVSHERHLQIMRDISWLALSKVCDPVDQFGPSDYDETMTVIESAVEDPNFVWQAA